MRVAAQSGGGLDGEYSVGIHPPHMSAAAAGTQPATLEFPLANPQIRPNLRLRMRPVLNKETR